MDKVISLYKDGVTPVAFPTGTGLSQIVIHDFTYTASRMGKASTITAKFEYGADLDGQWGDDIYATFNGEKYYLSGTPNSSYSNEDTRYTYEITLIAKRVCFERIYFLDVVSAESDVTGYVSNSSKVNFYGDLAEFVARLNENIKKNGLDAEYGARIDGTSVTVEAYPKAFEPTVINFEDKYIFDAIADDCYNAYEVPFYWASETVSNATKMMLVFGEASGEVSTVFEYGIDKSLLSIQRNNASEEIITRCTGYGSSDNLPWYYPNETSTGHHTIDPHFRNSVSVNYINYEIVSRYCNLLDENDVILHIVQSDLPPGTSLEDIKVQSAKMVFQGTTTNSGSGSGTISFSKSNFTSDGTDSPSFEITYEFYAPHDWEAMFSLGSDVLYGYGGKRATRNETVTSLKLEIGGTFTEILNSVSLIYYNQASGTWPSATTQVLGAGATSCKYSFKTPEDNQSHTVGYRYRMTVQYTMTIGIPSAYNYFNASFSMEMSGVARGAYLYPNGETTKHVSLSECGIVFSDPTQLYTGDWILIHNDPASYMEPQANLMPPIFRATQGERRFYEAKNYSFAKTVSYIPDSYKYPDPFAEGNHAETTPPYKEGAPFDGEYVYGGYVHNRVFAANPEAEQASLSYYSFANLFVQGKQREHIQEFPDIKPTIAGTTNAQNQRIDQILDVAFDNNDTDDYTIEDEQKNYTHDYFYIKLRKFSGDSGFNLFDHAIDSGAMTINMTSGLCGGCKFEIMVDENTKKNPVKVDANGNLLRDSDGNVDIWKNSNDYQASQNDTSTNEVWIAVKKDIDTFGVIMPNRGKSYIPSAGDTFVITGIDLPSSYIYEAEKRLEAAIIKYMYENNDEKFSFSIGFSRIFFAHNNAVLQQMRESAKIQIRYPLGAAEPISTYITTFTYKMEDGSPLPQISVELADKITLPRTMVRRLTKTIVKTLNINGSSSSDVAAAASAARRAAAQQQSSSSSFNDADYVHQGEVGAITKQMLGDDTVEYIDAIGTRVTTIEDWFDAPSLDALTVGALTSTSIAVDGIGITKDSSNNLLLGGNTKVSGNLTVTGNSSLGTVTSGTWQGTAIEYAKVAAHYIGRTRTQSSAAAQVLAGITQYQFEGQSGNEIGFEIVLINGTTRAIHTTLPLYSDSWIASGGVGSGGGGGGGGSSDLTVEVLGEGNVITNVSFDPSTSVLSFSKSTTLGTAATRNVASSLSSASGTGLSTEGAVVNYVASQLSSFSTTLGGLTDVTLSSPSNGQVLTYNSSTSKWANSSIDVGVITVTPSVASGSHLSFSVSPSSKKGNVTLTVGVATNYAIPSVAEQTSWTNSVTVADNAATAIAAINARTIWGHTFNGDINGHLYLLGANASSSTASTSQVVFGTGTAVANQHVVISSNSNALIINPKTNATTGQIVLHVGSSPYITINSNTVLHEGNYTNYAANSIKLGDNEAVSQQSGLITITGAQIASAIGNNPVAIATTATKLSTTSETAWGRTYWTSGGVPTSISGDMSSVGKVTFTAKESASSSGNVLEVVTINGVAVLHSVMPFYSDSWVASGGIGNGGGGSGATVLNDLDDVSISGTPANGQILSYNSTTRQWVNTNPPATGVTQISTGVANNSHLTFTRSSATGAVTLTVGVASDYAIPLASKQTSWDDAVTKANSAYSDVSNINSRTIWGQTFNGNVSGNMTGVGTINGYSLGGTIANNNNGFVTGDAVYDYAAKAIFFGGTTYTQSGGLITITTANIISAIGTAPVARATADASGNTITTTYATKSELASVESDVLSANNAIAENRARIEDIEAWKVSPTANTAYIKSLGVNTINLDGLDIWRESNVAIVGGNIKAKISSSSDASVKAENSSGQIGLVASNGIRGIQNFASTNQWLIATNGTNTKLLLGNVSIGADYSSDYKLYVGGATSITGNTSVGGTLGVLGTAVFGSGSNYGEVIRIATSSNKKRIYFGSISDSTPYLEVINVAASGQTPVYAFHFSKNLYADGWVASGGIGSSSGGGGGASTLNDLDDVTITGTPQAGQILTYENNAWRNVTPSYNYASSVKVGNTTYQSQNNLVTIPFSVVSPVPTLSWGQEVQIASLAGKDIKVKLPSEPSYSAATSDTLGGIMLGYTESEAGLAVKLNTASKAYVLLTATAVTSALGNAYVSNATYATSAGTATNLTNAPTFTTSGNAIKLTVGGQQSAAYTVPYATNAAQLGGVAASNYVTLSGSQALTNKTYNGYTLGAACAYGAIDSVTNSSGGSGKLVTSGGVYTYVSTTLQGFVTNDELSVTNNAVAENRSRIIDLEGWKANPTARTMYVGELGVRSIDLDGLDIWREDEVAVFGGSLAATKSTSSDTFIKARNSVGQIGLVASSPNRGVWDFSRSTPNWLIATEGTNTWLNCGNVGIGISNPSYKLHVNGTLGVVGATTLSSTLTFTNGAYANRKIVFSTATGKVCNLVYDYDNNAIHIVGNLYADGWIASGGIGSGSGGGGGVVSTVYGYSALGGTFNNSDLNNTFNAYTINAVYGMANSAIQSVAASTTDSSPSYVLTSISKSGTAVTSTKAAIYYNKVSINGSTQNIVTSTNTAVSFYAPTTAGTSGYYLKSNGSGAPTWAALSVTHLGLSSIGDTTSLDTMLDSAGLEVRRLGNVSDAPSSYSYGSMIQWSRYVGGSGNTVNTASQLYVPYQQNKLYFRNSWATGHNPTGNEWKAWLEVATIAADGSGTFIRTLNISASRVGYNSGYIFKSNNLVTALYNPSGALVMADVTVTQDTNSSSSTYGLYAVGVSFAETTTEAYKLVVFGI